MNIALLAELEVGGTAFFQEDRGAYGEIILKNT